MATPAEWSRGYARQAQSDLDQFETLETAGSAPACHKLQFLQMSCEKLVKAYLCGAGTDPAALQTSHAYVAGTLPVVLRQQAVYVNFTGPHARWVLQHAAACQRDHAIGVVETQSIFDSREDSSVGPRMATAAAHND